MPAGHRPAHRRLLRRADPLGAPLITGVRERGPDLFGTMFESIRGEVPPRIVRIEADDEHLLCAVAAGVGLTVITASRARVLRGPSLAVRRFQPPEPEAPRAIARRAADASPALARLPDTARALPGHRPCG